MFYRSRAPLRIGLAGGGTDVSPYADQFGGAILNATVSMYAQASLQPLEEPVIILEAVDLKIKETYELMPELPIDGPLALLKGVYNRVVKETGGKPLAIHLTTWVDAPKGSGMGTSSTLTVAILGAFAEWLQIPLGEYDMAHMAYEIERIDLGMAGGRQDQYAATFGGFNFMEFFADDKVIVNPLRIRPDYLRELEFNILLYYTGTSRLSADIIEKQSSNFTSGFEKPIEAAHKLKEQALMMKQALYKGDLHSIGEILDFGWTYKKQTALGVTNPLIDEIYSAARLAGATGGKISGAGGGGFMMFYVPGNDRYAVADRLLQFGGELRRFTFTDLGVVTWTGA